MATKRTICTPLGLTKEDYPGKTVSATLELETSKGYRGGVEAEARVWWVGNGGRSHAFGFGAPGGDYARTVVRTAPTVRATQPAIDRMHAQVFTPEKIAELTAEALAHYPNATRAAELCSLCRLDFDSCRCVATEDDARLSAR